MTEFIFALKSLIATIVLIMVMQFEFAGATVEQRTIYFLRHSEVTRFLHQSARGGIKAGQDLVEQSKRYINSQLQKHASAEQRAQR